MSLRIAGIRPGQRIERGRNHQLEIAFGEHFVGVFPVEDFALLGDADLPLEGVHGLREDGAMRGAAAAADRAAPAVKEAQLHAALARHLVQGAMGAKDLPGAGEHAAVFVGVGVAQHDLLPVVPAVEQLAVVSAGPESRQMAGALRRSSIDSKSGTGIKPGSRSVPSTRTPPRRARRTTAKTSSTEEAPLITY